MMKNIFTFLLFILITFQLNAQTATFDLKWVNTFEKASVKDMEIDASGNCYIVGTFSDTVDFDLGAGTTALIADTTYRTFLAKYDNNGTLVFVKQLPGLYGNKIGLSKSGNIWVAAEFRNTVDIDPGAGVQNLTAYQASSSIYKSDYYLAKYDNSGNYLTAFTLVDSTNPVVIEDLTIDDNDNMFIAGDFENTVDFDPSTGVSNKTSNSNNGDIFVAKYDPSGSLLFVHHLASQGATLECIAYKVRTDASNNFYIAGYFHGNVDLDPSLATYLVSDQGGIDGFVAKYNSTGAFLFGGSFNGGCRALDVNPNGDFYVGGTMPDSMDADMGTGTAMLYSTNVFDVWLAHYSNAGNFASAKAFEGNNFYSVNDISISPNLNLLMAGYIRDTVDFDPGNTGGVFISNGGKDLAVMQFDNTTNLKRGMTLGGTGHEDINVIRNIGSGDFWVCGFFNDTVDFDPSTTSATKYTSTSNGGFFAKYNDPSIISSVISRNKELLDISIHALGKSIYVDFSQLNSVDATIEVYNLNGQLIHKQLYDRKDQLNIPFNELNPQVYVVKVWNKGAVRVKKVILQ